MGALNFITDLLSTNAGAGQKRFYDVPEKVFVENDGPLFGDAPNREYFTEEPQFITRFYDLLSGYYAPQNFLNLFYSLPEIFAPIHEIASRVADANWQLVKEWNDEVDYSDQQFNRLFSEPNPFLQFKQFVYQSVCYEILTGRQFWYLNMPSVIPNADYKDVTNWHNLPAQLIKVLTKTDADPYSATQLSDLISGYTHTQSRRPFTAANVLPLINFSLEHGYDFAVFRSMLSGASKPIANLVPVYEARGVIYIKRGALGWLVNRGRDANGPDMLTEEQRKELSKDHTKSYGLGGNKQPVSFTSANMDFVRTSMSIQELQPFDETLADAAAIYAVLRVPPHLIPSKDKSTYANADADLKAFYDNVIIPWAKRYAQIWTAGLKLNKYRRYIKPDYSHINVLQENRKERADVDKIYGEVWEQRWKAGACSLNEWITAIEGTTGTGPIYEKKIFEMTPQEAELVGNIFKLFNARSSGTATGGATDNTQGNGSSTTQQDTAAKK